MPLFPFNSSEKKKFLSGNRFMEETTAFADRLTELGLGSGDEFFDSDDDANFSDDTQGGGKPAAVQTLLQHPADVKRVKIDDST